MIQKFNISIINYQLFLLLLCSCNIGSRPATQEFENSQWRGEGRNGVYNETGLLKVWDDEGPLLLWKYEGLGDGYTSAAIAGEKIYITGLNEETLILFVLDLNGNLLNKKEVTREETDSYPGPRSTVNVNAGKLYIYNAFGTLVCLDEKTLEEVWSKEVLTDFVGDSVEWTVAESPLIVGEKIFVTPGGKEHNFLALNKNTGELIWSSPGESTQPAYCSPQYIGDRSVPVVVTCTADYIVAWNADTGEKLWSFPQKNDYHVHPNTPLYHNGMILSTSGYGEGAVMLRLKDGGKAVELVWKNKEMDNQMGGFVKVGDYAYAAGHVNKFFFCVDWNTGETKYKDKEIFRANVISADEMLYCYSERGIMYLINPNPDKFDPVSSFKVTQGTGSHWAHPVIHRGVLYIRHGDALMAYKIQ